MDCISSEFYNHSNGLQLRQLIALFNYVTDTGLFSVMWCEGFINPLDEHGETNNADNFRKIIATSALGKNFDNILNRRLQYAKKMHEDRGSISIWV